jgi:hypothetical protein
MRHLASFLFGLVLAPVIWFLAALGQFRLTQALPTETDAGGSFVELALGALLMAAGGVWLGLLLGSRISPLGPGVAGLAWLALGAAFVLDIDRIINALPDGPTGQSNLYELPLRQGYVFLIGVALLVPLFSPSRWRARAEAEIPDEPRFVPFGPVPEPLEEPANGRHDSVDRPRVPRTVGRVGTINGETPHSDGRDSRTGEHQRPPRQWGENPARTPWDH